MFIQNRSTYHDISFNSLKLNLFIFSWIKTKTMFSKKKKKPAISLPSNFQHRVHTGYDNSSNKFVGLPKQWASLVEDVAGSSSPRRPQPVIDPSTITPTDMLDLKVRLILRLKNSRS